MALEPQANARDATQTIILRLTRFASPLLCLPSSLPAVRAQSICYLPLPLLPGLVSAGRVHVRVRAHVARRPPTPRTPLSAARSPPDPIHLPGSLPRRSTQHSARSHGDAAPQGVGLGAGARGGAGGRPAAGFSTSPSRAGAARGAVPVPRLAVAGRAGRRPHGRDRADPALAGPDRRRALQRRVPRLARPRLRQQPLGLLPQPWPGAMGPRCLRRDAPCCRPRLALVVRAVLATRSAFPVAVLSSVPAALGSVLCLTSLGVL